MTNIANLLTEHIDIWTAAESDKKSGRGRASGNAGGVYGVKKLREFILELAVRGKLVPQDPNDEPASELLKRIQAEKAGLIVEGKLKKEKLLAPISEDEKLFELPKGWSWVRNVELIQLRKGRIPKVLNEDGIGLPYLDIDALDRNTIRRYSEEFTCPQSTDKDILVVCDGSRSGLILDGKNGIIGSTLAIVDTPIFIQNYIKLIFKQGFESFNTSMKGAAIPHLDTQKLLQNPTALPPLTEQHRIVAKVDKLMALCDQLEQQHSNAQEAHETLVSQMLATLTQSRNAAEFNANWQRINAHFDVLFTTEASINALKQTLLQLAVMGKLVPQDLNDDPASELLKRIQAEKAKLIAEGKLKKEKPIASISEYEKPFELPQGWEWTKVLDCSVFVTDGEHTTPKRTSHGNIPLVTAKNVRDGYMDYENTDFVDVSVAEKCWQRCKPEKDDLLMVSVGATLGRLTILEEAKDMVIVRSVTLIRPCILNSLYLSIAIKSPLIQRAIWGSVRQMAQPGLYLAQTSNLVFPLPPLEEQHRIVAKVDALMALCDQLKIHIQQINQQQQTIADALVAQTLKSATTQVIDLAAYRAAVTCNIIKRMQHHPAFGRTFAMKLLYLSQQHIGFETHLEFEREAAGPFDKWIYDFERKGIAAGWFGLLEKPLLNGHAKIEYQVKSAIDEPVAFMSRVGNTEQHKELDRLFTLFADKKTEEAEIVATLFAAWNDFLLGEISPTDEQITQEVRENWHSSKARFSPEQLKQWLDWMRDNNIVPTGKGCKTIYQQKLIQ